MRFFLDAQLAEDACPTKVAAHLAEKGWTLRKSVEIAQIWSLIYDQREFTVILPLDRELGDFTNRMLEVYTVLAKIEAEQVMRSLVVDEPKDTGKL